MENTYDLTKEPETSKEGKVTDSIPAQTIRLDTDQIPELADYNVDDKIELHIIGKVKSVSNPDIADNKKESAEKTEIVITLLEGGVMNMKEMRKEANDRNIDKKDWEKIQSKRGMNSK